MFIPKAEVAAIVRGHELVQAIYTLINSNQDFKPQSWSVDDAEVLLAAGRKILAGLQGEETADG
jgi:hypothetical protein